MTKLATLDDAPTDAPDPAGAARPVRRGRRLLGAPLGTRAFLGVVAAVFAATSALALLLPHDPYIRYQSFKGTMYERLSWVYDRLAHDERPIDVLFVGSSRTANGVNAAALEAALAERGREIRVANVSIPAAGFDWRLTVIRDAFKHHPEIKLVVWGVVEMFPRDGHQAFADLGTVGDILSSPWLINRNLPANLARLPYRQMEYAIADVLPGAFGYRSAFDLAAYPGPMPDHRDFADPDALTAPATEPGTVTHALALAAESDVRRRTITDAILPPALSPLEFGVSRHYVSSTARLTATHGAQMAFLFLPFYDGWTEPREVEWMSGHGAYWGLPLLREDPANYIDAAHASDQGIDRITPWLAERIAAALPE